MPRIEIIPVDWETSAEKRRGDGSPTIDVCWSCKDAFVEGDLVPDDILNDLSENQIIFEEGAVVGSTEVEHPPYEDDDYDCDCCGDGLSPQDN